MTSSVEVQSVWSRACLEREAWPAPCAGCTSARCKQHRLENLLVTTSGLATSSDARSPGPSSILAPSSDASP